MPAKNIEVIKIDFLNIEHVVHTILNDVNYIYDRKYKQYYIKAGCGFDIETSTIKDKDNNIVCGYCYIWQFSFNDIVIYGRHLNLMQEFFKVLSSIIKSNKYNNKKVKLMILDANLSFEWQYCRKYWYELGITEVFAKEKRDVLKLTVGESLEFREVIGLFGKSLADIAKRHCYTKKLDTLNYDKVRHSNTFMDKEELQYCFNDVIILSELGQYIYKKFYGRHGSLPLTSTGFIRNDVKRNLGQFIKQQRELIAEWMPDRTTYEMHRTYLFKAGVCGTNSVLEGLSLYNCKGADLVSDYPSQMENHKFPYGKITECDKKKFLSENKPYIILVELTKLKAKTSHSFLSFHKVLNKKEIFMKNSTIKKIVDNGRVYYCDDVVIYLSDVEYKTMRKSYEWEEEKILQCWEFEEYRRLPKYLLKVVEDNYIKKYNLKKEGKSETTEYKEAKEKVNGCFGMCATALYTEDYYINKSAMIDDKNENADTDILDKLYHDNISRLFLFPYWAFWITAYARETLIDVIVKYPDLIIQYDTDSIYYIMDDDGKYLELENYLNEFNERIETLNSIRFNKAEQFADLGTWEYTKKIDIFKGLGAKRYMYKIGDKIKTVVAGCPKGAIVKQYNENVSRETFSGSEFDFFQNGMYISGKNTGKLSSLYIDDYIEIECTDYMGTKQIILSPSSVVLDPCEFTLGLAPDYVELCKTMKLLRRNIHEN